MLRHTFATRSMESGMAYDVLQKMIGHKSIKTTIDTYCDVFEANEQKKCKYYEYIFTGKQLSLYA